MTLRVNRLFSKWVLLPLLAFSMVGQSLALELIHLGVEDLQFVNSDVGWIWGDDGLFRTSDGGRTWTSLNTNVELALGSAHSISDVFFLNEETGWLTTHKIVDGKRLLETADGGQTWRAVTFLPGLIRNEPTRKSPVAAVVWGESGVTVTDDQKIVLNPDSLQEVLFVSETHGWVLGRGVYTADGRLISGKGEWFLLQTWDGGVSWRRVEPVQDQQLRGMEFLNKSSGFLISENDILATSDGGSQWVSFRTGEEGLVTLSCGDNLCATGMFKGRVLTFRPSVNEFQLSPRFVAGRPSLRNVSVGSRNTIAASLKILVLHGEEFDLWARVFVSHDGGYSWRNSYRDKRAVRVVPFMLDDTEGWLLCVYETEYHEDNDSNQVFEEFKILYTTDGGKSWKTLFGKGND